MSLLKALNERERQREKDSWILINPRDTFQEQYNNNEIGHIHYNHLQLQSSQLNLKRTKKQQLHC